jgi:hypothetical protein
MSNDPAKVLKCTVCGRTIESCACCDELDCPPPICDRHLTEAQLKAVRRSYLHRGASMIPEVDWQIGT